MSDTTNKAPLIERLLLGREAKAGHPITCLNPAPTFVIAEVNIDDGRVFVRGVETCWFGERAFELLPDSSHQALIDALEAIELALKMGFSPANILDENSEIRGAIRAALSIAREKA